MNGSSMQDMAELADQLVYCLKDANNKVVTLGLACFAEVVVAISKLEKNQVNLIVVSIIACFGNSKPDIRESAISCLIVLMQYYPPENIFPIFLASSKQLNYLIRLGCVSCINSCLKMFLFSNEILLNLVVPILIEVLSDKSNEVREFSINAFVEVHKIIGTDALLLELQDRKVSLLYLKLICDRLKIEDFENKFLTANKKAARLNSLLLTPVSSLKPLLNSKSTGDISLPVSEKLPQDRTCTTQFSRVSGFSSPADLKNSAILVKSPSAPPNEFRAASPRARRSVASPYSYQAVYIQQNQEASTTVGNQNFSSVKHSKSTPRIAGASNFAHLEKPFILSPNERSADFADEAAKSQVPSYVNNTFPDDLTIERVSSNLKVEQDCVSVSEDELVNNIDPDLVLFAVSLKPCSIYSEKEFELELNKIAATLKDDRTAQWKDRVIAMQNLCSYIAGGAVSLQNFDLLLLTLKEPLGNQIQDLRSAVSKEACATVCYLCRALRQSSGSWLTMCEDIIVYLFKQIIKSHTVIFSESANNTIRCMLRYSTTPRLIVKLCIAAHDRAAQLRTRVAEYLFLVFHRFDNFVLEKYSANIEEAFNALLNDKTEETRSSARKAFWAYYNFIPSRATRFLNSVPSALQKTLLACRDNYAAKSKEVLPSSISECPASLLAASCPAFQRNVSKSVVQSSGLVETVKPVMLRRSMSARSTLQPLDKPAIVNSFIDLNLSSASDEYKKRSERGMSLNLENEQAPTIGLSTVSKNKAHAHVLDESDSDEVYVAQATLPTINPEFSQKASMSAAISASVSRVNRKYGRISSAPLRVPMSQTVPKDFGSKHTDHFRNKSDGAEFRVDEDVFSGTDSDAKVESKSYIAVPIAKTSQFSAFNALDPTLTIIPVLDVGAVLKKGKDSNWQERVSSFELFANMLVGVFEYKLHVDDCRQKDIMWTVDEKAESVVTKVTDLLDKLIVFFEDRLNDRHHRVCMACFEFLCKFFDVMSSAMQRYLERLVPLAFSRLHDPLESIRSAANNFVNLLCKLYSPSVMFPSLLRTLDFPSLKLKSGCLECMYHLCSAAETFLSQPLNMKQVLLKVGVVIYEPKYLSLRQISGLIFKILYDKHTAVFFAQFLLLPSVMQHSLQNILQPAFIPDFGRNLLLYQQTGLKFSVLSKIVKSNSTGNLRTPLPDAKNVVQFADGSKQETGISVKLSVSPELQRAKEGSTEQFDLQVESKEKASPEFSSDMESQPLQVHSLQSHSNSKRFVPETTPIRLSFAAIPSLIALTSPVESVTISDLCSPVQSTSASLANQITAQMPELSLTSNATENNIQSRREIVAASTSEPNPLVLILESISDESQKESNIKLQSLRKLLQFIKQNSHHSLLVENFQLILPLVFNCFKDKSIQIRDLAFLILSVLVQLFAPELKLSSAAIVDLFLSYYQHPAEEVRAAAIDALISLVPVLDSSECYAKLLPLVVEEHQCVDVHVLLRFLSKIIAADEAKNIAPHLETFAAVLSKQIKNDSPDVRKNSVFCLVELLVHFGDSLDANLAGILSATEMRLIRIYYNKRGRA